MPWRDRGATRTQNGFSARSKESSESRARARASKGQRRVDRDVNERLKVIVPDPDDTTTTDGIHDLDGWVWPGCMRNGPSRIATSYAGALLRGWIARNHPEFAGKKQSHGWQCVVPPWRRLAAGLPGDAPVGAACRSVLQRDICNSWYALGAFGGTWHSQLFAGTAAGQDQQQDPCRELGWAVAASMSCFGWSPLTQVQVLAAQSVGWC
jgi:hypothetical protein